MKTPRGEERQFSERRHCLLRWLIAVAVAVALCLLVTACKSTENTSAPTGPKSAELVAEMRVQIAALREQVTAKDAIIQSVAGNVYGVQRGTEHIPGESRGKVIVTNEAKAGQDKVGQPTPEGKAAADARVEATLRDDLAEMQRLYGIEKTEADALRARVDEQNKALQDRDARIATLAEQAKREQANAEKAIADLRTQLENEKKKWSDSLQKWASRGLVGAGIITLLACGAAFAFIGVAALKGGRIIWGALAGLMLIGCGFIVGHKWFMYGVWTALAAFGVWLFFTVRHLYRTGQLEKKLRMSIQDLKDEAKAGVPKAKDAFETLSEHLNYHMPRKSAKGADEKSVLEKEIDERLRDEGVVV